MFLRKTASFILFSLLLTSCVEVYDIRYDLNADVLTVDGFVTAQLNEVTSGCAVLLISFKQN